MSTRIRILLIILLVATAATGGVWYFTHPSRGDEVDPSPIPSLAEDRHMPDVGFGTPVLVGQDIEFPQWQKDGKALYFFQSADRRCCKYDLESSMVTTVKLPDQKMSYFLEIDWSADGQELMWISNPYRDAKGRRVRDVCITTLRTQQDRTVATLAIPDDIDVNRSYVLWLSSQRLFIQMGAQGYLVNPQDGRVKRLPLVDQYFDLFVPGQDGSALLYVYPDGNDSLLLNLETMRLRHLKLPDDFSSYTTRFDGEIILRSQRQFIYLGLGNHREHSCNIYDLQTGSTRQFAEIAQPDPTSGPLPQYYLSPDLRHYCIEERWITDPGATLRPSRLLLYPLRRVGESR